MGGEPKKRKMGVGEGVSFLPLPLPPLLLAPFFAL